MSSEKIFQCYIVGEGSPYLKTSKAVFARFMEAVLLTGSRIDNTYILSKTYYPKSSWIASISIPEGKEEEFKKIAGCDLKRHPDIRVGHDLHKSVKYYTEIKK